MTTAVGTPTGTPDETPDETHVSVLPQDWRTAKVEFDILVEEGKNDGFEFTAVLTPGDGSSLALPMLDYFRRAGVTPRLGEYTFSYDGNGLVLFAPDGTTDHERRSLVMWLREILDIGDYYSAYIRDLRAFPSSETINAVARDVVSLVILGAGDDLSMEDADLIDPNDITVKGVNCIHCGFGREVGVATMLSSLLGAAGIDVPEMSGAPKKYNGVLYGLVQDENNMPALLIGYLSHGSRFGGLLNGVLAQQMVEAIALVTPEVVLELKARAVIQERMLGVMVDNLNATFETDPFVLDARVTKLERQFREDMGIHDEPEDAFENDLDPIGDEPVDEDAISAAPVDGIDNETADTGTADDEPETADTGTDDGSDEPEADDESAEEPEPEADEEPEAEVIDEGTDDEPVDEADEEPDAPAEEEDVVSDPAPEEETSPPPAS